MYIQRTIRFKCAMAMLACVKSYMQRRRGKDFLNSWEISIVCVYFMASHSISCQFSPSIAYNFSKYSHYIIVSDSVLLFCNKWGENGHIWKRDNVVLNIGTYILSDELRKTFKLSVNFSLSIEDFSIDNEGEYSCSDRSTIVTIYKLHLIVPPKLFLSYDNVILANASYHKDHGYETYHGDNTYVAENKTINVTCLAEGAKPKGNITWMINGEIIDNVSHQVPKPNLQENRTFDSLSTLQFSTSENYSTVTCNVSLDGTDINVSTSVTFLTYVEPRVFFLLNGSRVYKDEAYVEKNETVKITCCAEGSRPPANLTWDVYVESLQEKQNDANNSTFDTYISLTILPGSNIETITCRSSIVEIDLTETVHLKINTYVLREPSIKFNGKSYDTIPVNHSVTLTCNGAGYTPQTTLTWKINGRLPQEPTHKVSRSLDLSDLILTFQPRDNDLVECYSYLDGPNITRVVNVTFRVNDVNGVNDLSDNTVVKSFDYIINVIVPCAAVILIVLLVLCICCASRRLKGSQSANFQTSLDIPMEETLESTQSKTKQKEYIEDANKTYPKPPDLDLPQIPGGSEVPYYSELPEKENAYELYFHTEYYSAMGKSGASGKMYCEKDICFILNMKMGHIYDRWMGTIEFNPKNNKCVILSTVSESLRQKEIQWEKLVKRILELPEATHLTKVEGIGIYEGKLYLIHEHLACETLDVRISDSISPTEVMGHVTGILEGLEVIQSSGLLHPGLSTKKVLLTKKGVCKLYDFCLSEDASDTVRIRKSRITCTLNQLAPEALLRDKYSKASDVWSVAVVIWEILSRGSPPFANEEQSPDSEKAVYTLPETWPTKYKLLRNKILFECWNQDTSLRPSTLQLKSSFIESFESLDTYGPSSTSTEDLVSSYVHMKGIDKSKEDS